MFLEIFKNKKYRYVINLVSQTNFKQTFEYLFFMNIRVLKKRQVKTAVKYIPLIEETSAAYIFCNKNMKYSFVNFLSIFSLFKCFCTFSQI